ncbi:hypothetical protein LFYK43_03720 [Ligilactobacillus salitolerans]|uniref:endopeptidase La n=1 Tax=Ligilactobacillus salitolerans TaxID=1808352 RepID=A0A401IQX1_9LACO|nr:SepM family pheromone-processing serine protease [Ligilactobacillus salitolerans]GBG93913.1 hypothetical protein LFYK43_03720 [Ligilactobacillus salitolerans]
MKKIIRKLWPVFAVVLIIAFAFLPLPVYLESPGAAKDVSAYVRVSEKKDEQAGKLMLVYINESKATPLTWLLSFTDHYTKRVSAREELGSYNDRQMAKISQYDMQASVAEAKYRSSKLAHYPAQRNYIGLYVLSVLHQSNFARQLKIGDVITSVNGRTYQSSASYIKAIAKLPLKKQVTINFLRGNKVKQATGKLIKLPGVDRNGLGITLADRVTTKSSVPIKVNMQGIGGPSAGMMLTLQMYSQLSGDHFFKDRKIAGTGTMEGDGSIGQIGGISQKVVAAKRAHADIFLAPHDPRLKKSDNYWQAAAVAKKLKTKMKVVPVKNIDQAISYLKSSD